MDQNSKLIFHFHHVPVLKTVTSILTVAGKLAEIAEWHKLHIKRAVKIC